MNIEIKSLLEEQVDTRISKLYASFCNSNKCAHCTNNFEGGVISKAPSHIKEVDAYQWFTPEYLFHVETTHGYDPDTLTMMIKKFL